MYKKYDDLDKSLLYEEFNRLYKKSQCFGEGQASIFQDEKEVRINKEIEEQWMLLNKGVTDARISDSGFAAWSQIQHMDIEDFLNKKVDKMIEND